MKQRFALVSLALLVAACGGASPSQPVDSGVAPVAPADQFLGRWRGLTSLVWNCSGNLTPPNKGVAEVQLVKSSASAVRGSLTIPIDAVGGQSQCEGVDVVATRSAGTFAGDISCAMKPGPTVESHYAVTLLSLEPTSPDEMKFMAKARMTMRVVSTNSWTTPCSGEITGGLTRVP